MGAFCQNCLSRFCEVEKLQLDLSHWFAARHNVGLVMLHLTRNRSGRFLTGRLRQHAHLTALSPKNRLISVEKMRFPDVVHAAPT